MGAQGPGPKGPKWPLRAPTGPQARVPNVLGMIRKVPAVPGAIGGAGVEIRRDFGFCAGSHKPRGWYLWPLWPLWPGVKKTSEKNFKPVFGVREVSGWLRAEKLVWKKILGAREATGGAENSKNGSRKWFWSSLVPRDQFFSTSRPMSAGPRPGPGLSVATTQSGCAGAGPGAGPGGSRKVWGNGCPHTDRYPAAAGGQRYVKRVLT